MKRLWINRFNIGTSRKYFKSAYYKENFGDRCAICRFNLEESCIDCKLNIDNTSITTYKNRCEYIWMFLLVEYKRPDSLFYLFDLNIIAKIYTFCIEGDYIENDCTIVLLKCKHIFHKHCFEKWIHKRLLCPLCNGNEIMPKFIDNLKYSPIDGSLIKIQKSKYNAQMYYLMRDDTFHIRGVMCQLLKHHKPGYDLETFYKLSLEKFPRWIDMESFEKAIGFLVDRNYIILNVGTNQYRYLP